jgi:hypothetical protein
MQWHKWVVLIAGSTGSALRAVRPPNLHITPDPSTASEPDVRMAEWTLIVAPPTVIVSGITTELKNLCKNC